jgi:hypothetical protein
MSKPQRPSERHGEPTAKQLHFLRELAEQRGQRFAHPQLRRVTPARIFECTLRAPISA